MESLLEKIDTCHSNPEKLLETNFSTDNEDKKYYKVRDHCHYTGKHRDAAHNIWNLRYKTLKEIPMVFYNGSITYSQRTSRRI